MALHDSKQYRKDLETTIEHIVDAQALAGSTVLVTGATGTIGSFAVDVLLEMNIAHSMGIRIVAAGRDEQKLKKRFCWAGDMLLNCVSYDVNQPIRFDIPVDYIIHAAGNATPAAFNGDPVGTITGNIVGTYHLLEYGRTHGMKRFCYVSSGEVYGLGDTSIEALSEDYCGPLDHVSPRSCYPSSKRTAETLCASYSKQYGVETVVVRPCHTYGPGMTAADNRAHAQFFRNALAGENIVLKSAGNQMRSYSYVSDCISGLLTVLLNGESANAYNLANPNVCVTIAELAQAIAQNAGTSVVFEMPTEAEIKDRSPIAKQVLAAEKLQSLGWTGAFDAVSGTAHTLTILRESKECS